jgi:hypothetical protein
MLKLSLPSGLISGVIYLLADAGSESIVLNLGLHYLAPPFEELLLLGAERDCLRIGFPSSV